MSVGDRSDRHRTIPLRRHSIGDPDPAIDLRLVNDARAGVYELIAGDTAVAGLTYDVAGDDRLVLLATSVLPDFRHRGLATELIRRVLDELRVQERTITIRCPIVRAFIDRNPEYADLVDARHPGVGADSHRSQA